MIKLSFDEYSNAYETVDKISQKAKQELKAVQAGQWVPPVMLSVSVFLKADLYINKNMVTVDSDVRYHLLDVCLRKYCSANASNAMNNSNEFVDLAQLCQSQDAYQKELFKKVKEGNESQPAAKRVDLIHDAKVLNRLHNYLQLFIQNVRLATLLCSSYAYLLNGECEKALQTLLLAKDSITARPNSYFRLEINSALCIIIIHYCCLAELLAQEGRFKELFSAMITILSFNKNAY